MCAERAVKADVSATGFKYLIRTKGKKQTAHLWDGNDTVCRMYSTGGLKPSRYIICDSANGKNVCWNCRNNLPQSVKPQTITSSWRDDAEDVLRNISGVCACRRCDCKSCDRDVSDELHNHICTHGPDCVNSAEKLLQWRIRAIFVLRSAATVIREAMKESAQ